MYSMIAKRTNHVTEKSAADHYVSVADKLRATGDEVQGEAGDASRHDASTKRSTILKFILLDVHVLSGNLQHR